MMIATQQLDHGVIPAQAGIHAFAERPEKPEITIRRSAHREARDAQLDLERLIWLAVIEQARFFRALQGELIAAALASFRAGRVEVPSLLGIPGQVIPAHQQRLAEIFAAARIVGLLEIRRDAELEERSTAVPAVPTGGTPVVRQFAELLRGVTIENAVEHIRSLPVIERARWEAAVESSRQMAFTASGVEQRAALTSLRNLVAESLDAGLTPAQFESRAADLLRNYQTSAGRLRTLWNTTTGSALAHGREEAFADPAIARVLTHRMFDAMLDFATRPNHRALDNGIAPADWSGWAVFAPLLGFNCRCTLIGITAARARRMIEGGTGKDLTAGVPAGAGPDPGFLKR